MTLQVDELGQLILNVCRAAPDGVVVFLPSYDYETTVHARWAASGALGSDGIADAPSLRKPQQLRRLRQGRRVLRRALVRSQRKRPV